MGRGAAQHPVSQPPSVGPDLSGDKLVAAVYLSRDAVINWARMNGGPDDYDEARFQLLDTIRSNGRFSERHPEWMTSPKPGVDAWIELSDKHVLSLVSDDRSGRRWLVRNCLASRRRPGARNLSDAPTRARITEAQLNEIQHLDGNQLVAQVRLSNHCLERFQSRVLAEPSRDNASALERLISTSGRVVAAPPAWADGAGHGSVTLLIELDDDQLALPLVPNGARRIDAQAPALVATTCISRSFAQGEQPLHEADGSWLAENVHIASGARRVLQPLVGDEPDFDALLRERGRVLETPPGHLPDQLKAKATGTLVEIRGLGCLRLRPTSEHQLQELGRPWVSDTFIPYPDAR